MRKVDLVQLIEAGAHFGHLTRRWNPKMKSYIFMEKNGIHIIDLKKTQAHLTESAEELAKLVADGKKVRVVSMPSWELFEAQDQAYRDSVLPKVAAKRLSVEAGTSFGWQKYTGSEGGSVSIERFGASAPGATVMDKFGFSVDNVIAKAKEIIG